MMFKAPIERELGFSVSASNLGYDVVSILAKRVVPIPARFAALLWLLGVYQLTLRLRTELFDAEA